MDKLLLWTPRLLSILYILFVSMFALDVFSENESVMNQLIGFLVHLIPSFLLIVALVTAWKFPHIGGFLFILLALAFTFFYKTTRELIPFISFTAVPLILGLLFIWQWRKK